MQMKYTSQPFRIHRIGTTVSMLGMSLCAYDFYRQAVKAEGANKWSTTQWVAGVIVAAGELTKQWAEASYTMQHAEQLDWAIDPDQTQEIDVMDDVVTYMTERYAPAPMTSV